MYMSKFIDWPGSLSWANRVLGVVRAPYNLLIDRSAMPSRAEHADCGCQTALMLTITGRRHRLGAGDRMPVESTVAGLV
jgi:hypothetical protein